MKKDEALARKYHLAGLELLRSGHEQSAVVSFRKAREVAVADEGMNLHEAMALMRLMRQAKHRESGLQELVSAAHSEVLFQLGNLFLAQRDADEARHWYQSAAIQRCANPQLIPNYLGSLELAGEDEREQAVCALTKAIVADDSNTQLWQIKTLVLLSLGRTTEAAVTVERFIKKKPSEQEALHNFFNLLLNAKQINMAEQILVYSESNSNSTFTLRDRYNLCLAKGEKHMALDCLERLLGIDSSLLTEKAKILVSIKGKAEEASSLLAERILLETDDNTKRELTAYLLLAQLRFGNAETAHKLCLTLLDFDKSSIWFGFALFAHPFLLSRLGEDDKRKAAVEDAEAWLRLMSGQPLVDLVIWIYRILLADADGQTPKRDSLLAHLVGISPNDSDVQQVNAAINAQEEAHGTGLIADIVLPLWREYAWQRA